VGRTPARGALNDRRADDDVALDLPDLRRSPANTKEPHGPYAARGNEPRLDRLSERVRRSLETSADLGQFSRCEVDALLLYLCALVLAVRALLLAINALPQHRVLSRHLLDFLSEFGQLSGDARYVFVGCDFAQILNASPRTVRCPSGPWDPGRAGSSDASDPRPNRARRRGYVPELLPSYRP
jgi:hypothetical protein